MVRRFSPGQILLVTFPFTDHTVAKLRPALVVSKDEFSSGEDFTAVPISSRVDETDPFSYVLRQSEAYFGGTGLRCDSAVKWTKVVTISERVVQRILGTLPSGVVGEIAGRIKSIFP
jgi:mRNA interferase MazF